MAKPKIALVPAAQGSKFYSVLPSSGVGDFNFTRSGSATRINSQGLIETVGNGVSRLNYPMIDGKVVGCPSHLLEPSRTNVLSYSEDFSQSYWTKNNVSIVSNDIISPDGTLNADKMTSIGTTSFNLVETPSLSGDYTLSFYAKKGTSDFVWVYLNGYNVIVDLSNGTYVTSISNAPNSYLISNIGNGWYRISVTQTSPSADTVSGIGVANSSGFNGVVGEYIYIYGAMLEAGSYPTSYIPTNGSAVTRSAEVANGSGDASTFNDSEGVLMTEISALANDSTSRQISLSSGSSATNKVSLNYTATSNQVQAFIRSGGSIAFNVSEIVSDTTNNNKIALKYKQNDFALWVNGIELATNTIDGNTPTGLNVLDFDDADGTSNFYGNTKQLQYYDSALTDSELETLTSWVSFQDMAEGQLYTIE